MDEDDCEHYQSKAFCSFTYPKGIKVLIYTKHLETQSFPEELMNSQLLQAFLWTPLTQVMVQNVISFMKSKVRQELEEKCILTIYLSYLHHKTPICTKNSQSYMSVL